MTQKETSIIMDILKTAYPRFYNGPGAPDKLQTLNLWAEMFADDDVAMVAAAVKSYIASDVTGYPPHIGAIKNAMYDLTQAGSLDAAGAWQLVRKAIANSGYESKREFDRLPENVRRIVGSPSQLRDWGMMDSDTVHSVVASNFQRAYRARQESMRRDALLPADVKRLLSGVVRGLDEESRPKTIEAASQG